ncbi:MAG: RNA polymerase subunit sigma-70 [Propionibacteriaceae bacterium]|nr:RNA polymerase subunit sigma-70 [Propionibacteriaceae bacterium]
MDEPALVRRARAGDLLAFEELVAPHRAGLHAHCYRMLASAHDADDALQDALVGAWRGIGGFEGRSSVRGRLYRIATNAALRISAKRPKRQLSLDVAPACPDPYALGEPLTGEVWVEPYLAERVEALSIDPAAAYEVRETVELAFVAALKHLPASQRAVLLLREVLAFSASETAEALDVSVAAVNSQLQRARATLARRLPGRSQQAVRAELGTEAERRLVSDLVNAWQARDVDAFVGLLVDDVRLSMPPLPAWFDGAESVRGFLARMFETPWRLDVTGANAQPALVCWQGAPDGTYHLGGLTVLTLHEARIAALTCFLAPLVEDALVSTDEFGSRRDS